LRLAVALGLAVAALLAACQAPVRRLHYDQLVFDAPHHELAYAIYTPPGFERGERLPLVVFLHGAGDDETCFDEAGVGVHLDAEIAAGRVPRAVIAVPSGDFGFWENWADGSYAYRDWIVDGLVPAVAARYGTLPCPDDCHVIGISMGGHGALRLALFEPERFASASVVSGPILDTDAALEFMDSGLLSWVIPSERIWGVPDRAAMANGDVFQRWTRPEDLHGVRLLVAWGDRDYGRIVESNERFRAHLDAHDIPYEAFVFEGGHRWQAWTPALDRVLTTQLGSRTPSSRP